MMSFKIASGYSTLIFAVAASATAASPGHSQNAFTVKPANEARDSEAGGTDRAAKDAKRLAASGAKMSTIRNLAGPADPVREKDVDTTTYDVSQDVPGLAGYLLRSRYIEVGPEGIVPIHPHDGRPGILQIVEGEIVQHRSDKTSDLMLTGDITLESQKIAHWWENVSDKPVRIWSVDLCNTVQTVVGTCTLGLSEGSTAVGTAPRGGSVDGPQEAVTVKSPTNAQIELAAEFPTAGGLQTMTLRSRTVIVEPKGVIPLHGHKGRPTFFRVMQGTITYRDAGEQRRFNKGQVVLESGSTPHWWTNDGDEAVVLHAIDVFDKSSGS